MAEFIVGTLVCRTTRPTRLYRTPYDMNGSLQIIQEKTKFYSRKQYKSGDTMMLYISEGFSDEVPTGYWCPAATVEFFPIVEESEKDADPNLNTDGIKEEYTTIIIKNEDVTVYRTKDSTETEPHGLKAGDRIVCDRSITVQNGKVSEARYRIATVFGDDTTVVGCWIAGDRAEELQSNRKVTYHNPNIKAAPAKVREAGIMPLEDDSTTTKPEVNPNQATFSDGTTVEVPTVSAEGEDAYDDVVQNTVDLNNFRDTAKLYEEYGYSYATLTKDSYMSIPLGRMLFVHGMPFQWTHITDRRQGSVKRWGASSGEAEEERLKNSSTDLYGRTFARDIAANMPIVVFAPGKPKFMTSVKAGLFGYTGQDKNAAKNFIPVMGTDSGSVWDSVWNNMQDVEGDFQYYTIEIDNAGFYENVNSMCRTSAKLMGLSDVKYRKVNCDDIDWGTYNSAAEQDFSTFETVMGLSAGASFVFDPQSSISDTLTNSTTESQFASFFSDISSKTRELEFILGYTGSGLNDMIDSQNYVEAASNQLNSGALAGFKNAVDRIGTWLKNSIHGMNMKFPEIWSDSGHSPSYEIDMHFIAPYATAFCKWRYVLVPFFHIFCLAGPKSNKSMSQYSAPFLIRAYSKAYFNIEMGIIESLTWKRFGDGDMISEDGIPTQIDVSVSLKDLYHTLAITNMYNDGEGHFNVSNFMNNTGLMDLIGTLSGVNMNRISIGERISLFVSSNISAFGSLGGNFMRHVSDRVRNISSNLNLYGV